MTDFFNKVKLLRTELSKTHTSVFTDMFHPTTDKEIQYFNFFYENNPNRYSIFVINNLLQYGVVDIEGNYIIEPSVFTFDCMPRRCSIGYIINMPVDGELIAKELFGYNLFLLHNAIVDFDGKTILYRPKKNIAISSNYNQTLFDIIVYIDATHQKNIYGVCLKNGEFYKRKLNKFGEI